MKSTIDFVLIKYVSIYHELECERFDWVSETLKAEFEDEGNCYRVFVYQDRLELIVIWALAQHIMILLERYKYKYIDSDMFEYLSSLRFVDITWWNDGQINTESNCRNSESETRMQSNGACVHERNRFIGIWRGQHGGKFI